MLESSELMEYKGKFIEMSKDKKNKKDKKRIKTEEYCQGQDTNQPSTKGYIVPKSTITVLKSMGGILCILVTTTLGVIGWMGIQLYEQNATIKGLKSQVNEISTEVGAINRGLDGANGLYAKVAVLETKVGLDVPVIEVSEEADSLLIASVEPNDVPKVGASIEETTCIGTDVEGNVYLAGDLRGKTILLTYEQDGKQILFLGAYNDQYHWDGYCVINAYYDDERLYGICESNFDNGTRLDYKSFVRSDDDDAEWIYSDKECQGESNKGVNIQYKLKDAKTRHFIESCVKETDIKYVDDFITNSDAVMLKYYKGESSKKLYQDASGNAYEVIYNEDGTVKTLYVGQFANGTFNDNTGNAWDISYAENYGYVYNKGEFKNGTMVGDLHEQVDVTRIKEIIAGYKFDCELTWKQ